jgi:hypothetical protein
MKFARKKRMFACVFCFYGLAERFDESEEAALECATACGFMMGMV